MRIVVSPAVVYMLGAALLSIPIGANAQDRFSNLAECAAGAAHAEQRACLEQRMSESLAALGEAQKQLMGKLRSADQEARFKQAAITAAQLDAQAYITYAGKHCESFVSLAYGGNSQGDRRLACHIELNLARAQQVRKVAESLP